MCTGEQADGDESDFRQPTPPSASRWSFIVTVWVETADGDESWRACVETASRHRIYFRTMKQLTDYVVVTTGWREPPA
jgi:hypothetical protein